jgi:hypothetical protein
MARRQTYLVKGKRYGVNDKKTPAEAKATIAKREKEFDAAAKKAKGGEEEEFVEANDLGPGISPDALPDDFPGLRYLREAGYTTYTSLAELAGEYSTIRGIGDATAEDITAYLEDRESEEG